MTTQEFIKYYKNGHGRAICALRNITDKEPYRKAFIECLKEQEYFFDKEEYILNLAKILLNEETKKEFVDTLYIACEKNDYFPTEVIKILLEFMPREEVVTFLEEKYEDIYNSCLKPSDDIEIQQSKNIRLCSLVLAINSLLGDDDNRLKNLIKDCAKLFDANNFDKKFIRPVLHLKWNHRDDEDRFSKLFDEALNGYPFYEKFHSIVFSTYHTPTHREYKTPEDYVKAANVDYHHAYNRFLRADAETVKKVAEIGIDENAEDRVAALSLFRDDLYYYGFGNCKPANFPLDTKYLIDIIEKYKKLYTPEPDTPIDGCWAFAALSVLARVEDKVAKEYCLSIVKDKSFHEIMRYDAISTFIANYEVADAELIKDLYFNGYENEVLMVLLGLVKQGTKDIPRDICFDAYENQINFNRSHAVFILHHLGILTDEMIEECHYDECRNIRDLVNGLPSDDVRVARGFRPINQ